MKKFIISTTLATTLTITLSLFGFFAFAENPPANYPAVNGVVKKIDLQNKQITLKHETIPNLNMPGMTMPFLVKDIQILQHIQVGDQIRFAADENADGDLFLVWIAKVQVKPITDLTPVFCTGIANTTPKTNIEVEVRQAKYSTIRYEYTEGPYKGTAYINSIGDMALTKEGTHYFYQAGDSRLDSKLHFEKVGAQIQDAKFYSFRAGMNFEPVQCEFKN